MSSSSSKSHWFWDWGYLAVAVAVLLGFWVTNSGDRENQNHVSTEVFESFKQIEKDCRAESFEIQTKRCVEVLKHNAECERFSSQCNSLSYYQLLKRLKYQLPAYYQKSYQPK